MLRLLLLVAACVGVVNADPYDTIWEVCGMDFAGPGSLDIGNAKAENPDACGVACLGMNGCDAVTWTNYQGGTCWFKKWPLDKKVDQNAISYYLTVDREEDKGTMAWRYHEMKDVDIPGYDIGSTNNIPNLDGCWRFCALSSRCWAVVWTDYQGGTCWFKSRGNAFAPRKGAQAMIMQRKLNELTYGKCPRL